MKDFANASVFDKYGISTWVKHLMETYDTNRSNIGTPMYYMVKTIKR
jgi:hypothetical protein